jgi:hypothetical protein
MSIFQVINNNTNYIAYCQCKKEHLQLVNYKYHNNKEKNINLIYFEMCIKYIFNDDIIIKYICASDNVNPDFNFDIIIKEPDIFMISDKKYNFNDFYKQYNITFKFFHFDPKEKYHNLFLFDDIYKLCKKILQKYNDNDDSESYKNHPIISYFFKYYKIIYEDAPEFNYKATEYHDYDYYTFQLKNDIEYIDYDDIEFEIDEPELLYFDSKYVKSENYIVDILKYNSPDINDYSDIFKYLKLSDNYKELSQEDKNKFNKIKKEIKCLYKNINKIPDPRVYINKIYNEADDNIKHLSGILKKIDMDDYEYIDKIQLEYINQYCRKFKFTGNNFLYIHDNIKAINIDFTHRYIFIRNQYCKKEEVDEDNFFFENKFYIEFNIGYFYYCDYINHNTGSGYRITQLKMKNIDAVIEPYFYNNICKLMEELSSKRLPDETVYDHTV